MSAIREIIKQEQKYEPLFGEAAQHRNVVLLEALDAVADQLAKSTEQLTKIADNLERISGSLEFRNLSEGPKKDK